MPEPLTKEQEGLARDASEKYIALAVSDANTFWKKIKDGFKNNPEMRTWTDDQKIDYFYKSDKQIYDEFPIVCRYMIIYGQYSSKAFQRYLKLKSLDAKNAANKQSEKGERQEQFIRREAMYVRYLWTAMQKGHYDEKEAKKVFQIAYDSLSREFDEFEKNYKNIEDRLKEESKQHDTTLAKELLKRVLNTEKKIDPEDKGTILDNAVRIDNTDKKALRDQLYARVMEQRKAKNLVELKAKIALVE